jgi:hypothetical protein
VAHFKLSCHLRGGTEENNGINVSLIDGVMYTKQEEGC